MTDIGKAITEIGEAMVALIKRGMVHEYFECQKQASSIGVTTHTGSVYLIDIKAGEHEPLYFEGYDYSVRHADATVNGVMYSDVYVGFDATTGSLLILDADYQMIRRSSSLKKIELID